MTVDGERRIVDGRVQWWAHGAWRELQAELAPDADLSEPAIASGKVSRLRPFDASPESLSLVADALGVEGEPELGEDEWVIVDPRGFSIAIGHPFETLVPRVVGGVRWPVGTALKGKGPPTESPLEGWPPGSSAEERLSFTLDVLRRVGLHHPDWEPSVSLPEWRGVVVLRPRVDGLVVGLRSAGVSNGYWTLGPDKPGTGLASVDARLTDVEPVTDLPLRGAEASFEAFLRGDLTGVQAGGRAVRTDPSEPAHTMWIHGVHMELAEVRHRHADDTTEITLLPMYVYTGEHIAADGTHLNPPVAFTPWPALGGLLHLPAVDYNPVS